MSANNGIIRIGRKGIKKFAFGDEGEPFDVDVVVAFQQWVGIDEDFRPIEPDAEGNRSIPTSQMPEYHQAAVAFVEGLAGSKLGNTKLTVAESLDFIARLREQYDELADFFRPRLREEHDSPDTSEAGLRFSEEAP